MEAVGTFKIVFRGVRGSYPVPGPTTFKYGGNTSCQEIRVGGRLLILDAGTGVIGLGQEIALETAAPTMAIFFSHSHHDHTSGILYFKPAYSRDATIHFYGPEDDPGSIMDTLEHLSNPSTHPVRLVNMGMRFTCDILHDGSVVRWAPGADAPELLAPERRPGPDDVVVRTLKNKRHPVVGVLNFRVEYQGKSYVYATDIEGDERNGDPELAAFARDADLLAHDGQYTSEEYAAARKGWGHSTVAMAIKTAVRANVGQLGIIHFEPTYDDAKLEKMEADAKREFSRCFFAREGMIVTL